MRIALASDLHLEFGPIKLYNTEQADVLVLSGDILLSEPLHDNPRNPENEDHFLYVGKGNDQAKRFRSFLSQVSGEFPHVVYVAGNHEFYNGKWCKTIDYLAEECAEYTNVYYLENQTKEINGVTFIGATLWTDMNANDPLTMYHVNDGMTDYQVIRDDSRGYTRLRPAFTVERHRKSVQYIQHVIEGKHDGKFIVVTHHAPTMKSIDPRYANDTLMNGAYASDLSEFILDNPQIKLWTHGHTHIPCCYDVGTTKVACNPRGYVGYEVYDGEYSLQYLDI